MCKPFSLILLLLLSVLYKTNAQDSAIIVVEGVNIIPMTEETVLINQRVLIRNGKIIKIQPATSPLPEGVTTIINGKGKYLIPGLSEMHYHFRSGDIQSDCKLLLANGITTVRNMSEDKGQDQVEIKRKTQSGGLWPLTYFTAGPYLTAKDLQSEQDVLSVVQRHKERGYDFLKLAGNLPENIYLALLEECAKNNIPVIGHAQRDLPLDFSLRMKSVEHVEEFVYLSKWSKREIDSKQSVAERKAMAKQVKSSDAYVGTTLVGFEFITHCLDDKKFDSLKTSSLAKYLSRQGREDFLTENNDYRKLKTREFDGIKAPDLFNHDFLWMKKFVRNLYENNVRLLTGSDTYGMVIVGFSLHREFALLQQAGMKPYDILLASTVNPARYLGTYAMEGTVSEGKNADLVLVNQNPLTDIRNTSGIEGVFLKGKWYDKSQINQMLKEVEAAYQ